MAQQGMPSTKHQRVSVEQFDQADEFENYYVISSSQEPALAAAEVLGRLREPGVTSVSTSPAALRTEPLQLQCCTTEAT